MVKSNCLVAQSGGPTTVINASLYGVIKEAFKDNKIDGVYGALNGIEGLLKEDIIDFRLEDDIELELLKMTPSSALGSCRYKIPEGEAGIQIFELIFKIFEKYNIKYFYYIGGNDSMDTVLKLSQYAKENQQDVIIVGIPKTIDNDLEGTDHCPGFGSAAKYLNTSLIEIWHDANIYNKNIITIVEVMGRDTGWLAASTALASEVYEGCPDLIYIPELEFDFEKFKTDVESVHKKKGKVIIVVSEGLKNKDGKYIADSNTAADMFGHVQLGGVGYTLKDFVEKNIEKRVKLVVFDVLQRCAMHMASATDLSEAEEVGRLAVRESSIQNSGKMVGIKRTNSDEYMVEFDLVPIEKAANNIKHFPKEWINENQNFINEKGMLYFKPLIEGEKKVIFENGLPRYTKLDFNKVKI